LVPYAACRWTAACNKLHVILLHRVGCEGEVLTADCRPP
jgi:hypothetical protein